MASSSAPRRRPRPPAPRARFEGLLLVAVFALAVISLVATLPQTRALLEGVHPKTIEVRDSLTLRLLREGWALLLTAILGLHLVAYRRSLGIGMNTLLLSLIVLVHLALTSALTLLDGYPPIVVAAGIRAFQYVPVAFAGFLVARRLGERGLFRFADLLRLYVVVLILLGLYQVLFAPPFSGQTVFGSRAFGTFPRANIFGMTMASCALWFTIAGLAARRTLRRPRYRLWLVLCAVGVILSGSRTAMILTALVLAYPLYLRLRRGWDRIATLPALPLIAALLLVAVSNAALTGRNVDLSNEGRLRVWSQGLQHLDSGWELLLGWGVGLGTTTLNNLVGPGTFPGQVSPVDSQLLSFLAGFGLVGLLLYGLVLWKTFRAEPRDLTQLLALFLVAIGIPFVIWEVFPANALLMMLWGTLIGLGPMPSADAGAQP